MLKLDGQSRLPIYRQLQNQILQKLAVGTINPGDALPSVRSLARDLAINPNTVAKAYSSLESMGVIYSVTGKGSFVAENLDSSNFIKDKAAENLKRASQDAKNSGVLRTEAAQIVDKVYIEGDAI